MCRPISPRHRSQSAAELHDEDVVVLAVSGDVEEGHLRDDVRVHVVENLPSEIERKIVQDRRAVVPLHLLLAEKRQRLLEIRMR